MTVPGGSAAEREPVRDAAPSLEEAVRSAVEQGRAELTHLDDLTDELAAVFAGEPSGEASSPGLITRLDAFARVFPAELRLHLDREREELGTFNIAFFGRTGAGKSTLLSAFGRLDGGYVSRSEGDWTTEVCPIEWRDCRLFDTPGINGWGRTESRAALEAKARRAVEIADVVLLCFDSISQQQMEFDKVADWIRDRGKPVVAVLNVRNADWRQPDRVPESRRANLSEQVRQNAGNIRSQLAQKSLTGIPIVAVHSRRALMGRATLPYRGPFPGPFLKERDHFGTDHHERWSNFATLERLIVASIAEGGADLRLAALRDDVRSRCRRGTAELERLAAEIEREAESLERHVESLFAVLGYPGETERATRLHDAGLNADLVDVSERARGREYTSPPQGSLDRFVRHLAAAHLAGAHRQAKTAVDDLIRAAAENQKVIDETAFTAAVFDRETIAAAEDAVWSERAAFLRRELEVVAGQEAGGDGPAVLHAARILGDVGHGVTGNVVRGTGIAVALAGTALPLIWNPAGWILGLTAIGVGLVTQAGQILGRRSSQNEAEKAREAKARAITEGHHAVDRTFAECEDALVRDSREAAWTLLAPAVAESLRAAVELRMALSRTVRLLDGIGAYAASVRTAPPVADVLQRAQRRLADSPDEVTRVLLGEDWLTAPVGHRPAPIDPAVHETYATLQEVEHARLAGVLAEAWSRPSADGLGAWRAELEEAARHDPGLFDVVRTFWRVDGARPAVAVLGDYNSGKSSLLRRIVVDSGPPPYPVFGIRASPATTAAVHYRLPRLDLVDTPGLQSGRDGHDAAALEAITEAALVLVVLQINLLVGDTSILEDLLRGSATLAAKGTRTLFLVNRSDELVVDPRIAAGDFVTLRENKRVELRAAFATRAVDVPADRVHCLSGDPFGLIGDDPAAEAGDFDEHRLWDGVGALTGALAGLSDEQLSAASSAAALDAALTGLKRHRHARERERDDLAAELLRAEPVIDALRAAVDEAALLAGSLREAARRMVDRHLVEAKSAVARIDRKDGRKLTELVESWARTPQFEADLEKYLADATGRLTDWYADHNSAIGREIRAAEFEVAPELATEFEARGNAWAGDLATGAGAVTGTAAKITKALGSRDAIYTIGKQFGVKFKPWGAVNAAGKVARAGIVLGAVAGVIDTAAMVTDHRNDGKHRQQQDSAAQKLDEAAARLIEQITRGEQDRGPLGYLDQQTEQLRAWLDEHLGLAAAVRERMDEAIARAAVAGTLITAAEALTAPAEGNE
ncbi:GTPase [Actinoplanes sp. HUAS TT8]|uniref:GTPase n=1 Tax=Actinoplanes sp. HUAS TT8 TaxID=3447453 RepID=UPI003F51C47A